MTLRLYNTLTRSLQAFEPLRLPSVSMYVCGPTVYDVPHIGHARSAFVFDVLRRYLVSRQYNVTFVRNVTDVDDKIIQKAKETGEREPEIAARYLNSYHDAMDRLGIARPDQEPKATEHIDTMLDFISKLVMDGIAYEAGEGNNRDVYFSVRGFSAYGRLSNRTLDELQAGARVEPGEHKRDPLDFALWKKAKPDEPSWKSPWGPGRPGWHIECSAMSTKFLGDAFDIHGGGLDLIFPHHENEIAQAQAAGKDFARVWIHHGLLTVNGEKMSKSLGNYFTVEQVLKDFQHPDYLKLFFLKTHYRSPIDYSRERIEEAKRNWHEFERFFQHAYQRQIDQVSGALGTVKAGKGLVEFENAMDDDLNTPKALAVLFNLVNAGHRMLESADQMAHVAARGAFDVLLQCGRTLGLFQQGLSEERPEALQRIQARIAEREAARKAKDFKRADEIRESLREEGYLLTDTAGGTLWRRAE